jgi:lipoprotein-anchoring transpeptidase ErfK/SrfK
VGASQGITGYGIHGTIDPGSIGKNLSMGCVRLRDEDIALVFELLAERISVVEIVP